MFTGKSFLQFAKEERLRIIAAVPPEIILMKRGGNNIYDIIKEYEFIDKLRFWTRSGIDSTYFYAQIIDKLNFDVVFSEEEKQNITDFINQLSMKDNGGIRQTLTHDYPSIHAVHCSIGLINIFYNPSRNENKSVNLTKPIGREILNEKLGEEKTKALIKFIKNCYSFGGFFQTPGSRDCSSTINDTASALWCLWHLEALEEDINFDKIKIFMNNCAVREDNNYSFKNRPSDIYPWACSTYYAMRIIKLISKKDPDCLKNFYEETNGGEFVLNFIMNAKHEGSGFGANQSLGPNIIHTKGALSLIKDKKYFLDFKSYVNNKMKEEPNFLEDFIKDIKEFLEKCKYNGVYSFADTQYFQPNMYATCLSIDIKNILTQLSTENDETKYSLSNDEQNCITEFLNFCYDDKTKGYRGYSCSTTYLPSNYIAANT